MKFDEKDGVVKPHRGPLRTLAKPGSRRLVCFPHAGGSATYFLPLVPYADDVEVVAVQYPGRQDRWREPCLESIAQIAEDSLSHLLACEPIDTVIFGHSMGALVAYEVTRRLVTAGQPPIRLCVSGHAGPGEAPGWGVSACSDKEIISLIGELGGTDRLVLDDAEFVGEFAPIIRADYSAVESYVWESVNPLTVPIIGVYGNSDPLIGERGMNSWASLTSDYREVCLVGGHFYLSEHWSRMVEEIGV